jgi:hypothetical protein
VTYQVVIPDAPLPARPKAVSVIGWTCLILSLLRFFTDLVGWLLWTFGGLREAVSRLLPYVRLGPGDPRLPYGLFFLNFGRIVVVQGLVAAFVAVVSYNLLRLRAWARTALEVILWIGLVVVAGLNVGFLVAWSSSPNPVLRSRFVEVVVAALIAGGLFGPTIWFLRRPDVRHAFENRQKEAPRVAPSKAERER